MGSFLILGYQKSTADHTPLSCECLLLSLSLRQQRRHRLRINHMLLR